MSVEIASSGSKDRVIVLLHGFSAHWLLMTRLQKHFRTRGYRCVNWGYKSWFKSIEHHATKLNRRLQELEADESVKSVDLVTHSMGCIVARAALLKSELKKTGRWVMLAPPHRGSLVANSVPKIVKRIMKPIDELQATDDSYVNRLPMPQDIDIAVIQATADYIVAEQLTRISEEKARLVVPGLHSQMLFREDVATQSIFFLQHGRFDDVANSSKVKVENK